MGPIPQELTTDLGRQRGGPHGSPTTPEVEETLSQVPMIAHRSTEWESPPGLTGVGASEKGMLRPAKLGPLMAP